MSSGSDESLGREADCPDHLAGVHTWQAYLCPNCGAQLGVECVKCWYVELDSSMLQHIYETGCPGTDDEATAYKEGWEDW